MSKIKRSIDDFLDNGGRGLGFCEDNLPDRDDFQIVLQQMIQIWEYKGLTKKQYYGGDNEQA